MLWPLGRYSSPRAILHSSAGYLAADDVLRAIGNSSDRKAFLHGDSEQEMLKLNLLLRNAPELCHS